MQDAKGLTTKHANATASAVSNAFKGVVAYFGIRQITEFGGAIFETGREIARLEKSFKEITGTTNAANKEFDFLRKSSDELGQNFYDLTDSYKSLLAASKGTVLEGEATRNIFIGITKAGATLGLTSDSIAGALNAVQQMMSKGKVQAEELRGQLGERLPGAFNLAAEAMGVTTQQLNKMLDDGKVLASDLLPKLGDLLQNRYSGSVDDATRASNKLAEAWTDVKKTIGDQGFMDMVTESMQSLAMTLKDKEFLDAVKALSQLFIYAAKVGKVTIEIVGGAYSKTIGEMGERILAAGKVGDQTGQFFKINEPAPVGKIPGINVPEGMSSTEIKEYESQLESLQKAIDASASDLSDIVGYNIDVGFDEISAARQEQEQKLLEQRQQSLMDYWEFEFRGFSEQADRLMEIEDWKAARDKEAKSLAIKRVSNALELIGRENETAFKIYKAYKTAEAIITGLQAAVVAWEAGYEAGGPYAGPYLAAAYAAASLAWTGAQISAINSTHFGSTSQGGTTGGGGVGGGYSTNTYSPMNTLDNETRGTLTFNIYGDISDPESFVDNFVDKINDAADRDVFINYSRETL